MERKPNRFLSGCLVWFISFLLVGGCLVPVSLSVGGMSTFFTGDLITSTLGTYMCPDNTDPTINTFESTEYGVDGFPRDTTYYELTCLNASGEIVENLGGSYALIWSGIMAGISLLISAFLAVILTIIFFRIFKKKTNAGPQMPPLVKIQ